MFSPWPSGQSGHGLHSMNSPLVLTIQKFWTNEHGGWPSITDAITQRRNRSWMVLWNKQFKWRQYNDHSINSSCNYSSYFYHFMIKTMHFNPCASFSPCSGIALALLPSLEEWRLDPKKTAEIISSVTRRRDQPPNRKPLVSALNKTAQYIANARRENCQLPMAITPQIAL